MGRMRWGVLVLVVLGAFVGAACSGGDDSDGGGDASVAPAMDGNLGQADADQLAEEGGKGSGGPAPATAARLTMDLPRGPSVIKTADLRIQVANDRFQDAFQGVINIAQKRGGFVLSSDTAGDESRRGSLTIRVPVETFESALDEIGGLGDQVHSSVSGKDVSEEFVDLQARLRNLTAQEAVLLRLMDRAETISDTIRVQNELTGIQLQTEQLRGRLRFLEDQTAFSTITVQLSELGVVPAEAKDPGTLERAWQVARETTGAIVSGVLIGGAALAPVAVVLLFAFLVFRWVRPRLGRVTGS